MEELDKAEEEDAERRGVIENQDGIGEKSKEEGEVEQVVFFKFNHGIDETEDDTGIFNGGGDRRIIVEGINQHKRGVNTAPS